MIDQDLYNISCAFLSRLYHLFEYNRGIDGCFWVSNQYSNDAHPQAHANNATRMAA